ncbi:MAG: hypothetical protein ACK57N_04590 [Planctomycetia bacterium]
MHSLFRPARLACLGLALLAALPFAGAARPNDAPREGPKEAPKEAGKPADAAGKGAIAKSPMPAYARKVAVVGASISADFGLRDLDAPKHQLPRGWNMLVDGSIIGEHETLMLAGSLVFMDPAGALSKQLDKAAQAGATTIIGLDSLFWFAYGPRPEEQRMAMFERGLALFDGVKAPLVLGDIPQLVEGPMLRKDMIPAAGSIDAFEARLKAWARGKDHVALVPLRKAAAAMHAGEEIVAFGHRFPTKGGPPLLQPDQLHTTFHGSLALWCLTLDSWRTLVHEDELFVVQQSPRAIQAALNWQHEPDLEVVQYRAVDPSESTYARSRGLRKRASTEAAAANSRQEPVGAPDKR